MTPDPGDDPSDRTVLPRASAELPLQHAIEEFVIEALVGEGGFSIVYLALDTRLNRRIALKEYMPTGLAWRDADFVVAPRTERERDTFELGLRSFVNEARLLASFDHPSLVQVYRFWEGNGTAYMAMRYYEGPTLKQFLIQRRPLMPDEAWLRGLLAQLLDVIERIHARDVFHRDIAPDNILLLSGEDGSMRPLLLDFGAARQVIGDATQALTAILKPGYAPIEQYAETVTARQGPWTDVYALCAVMYAAITGRAPIPSVSRFLKDELVPAAEAGAGRYSPGFLAAIDAGLAVRPEDRPASIAALRALFDARGYAKTVTLPPRVAAAAPAPAPTSPEPSSSAQPAGGAAPPRRAHPAAGWGLGIGAAVLLAGAASWWALRPTPPGPPAAPLAAQDGAAAVQAAARDGTPAAPPATPAKPGADSAAAPATAAAALPGTPPAAAPLPARSGPFSIAAALRDIAERRDATLVVQANPSASVLTIGRDRVELSLSASEAGHVYLLFGSSDRAHLYLLFPNARDRDNRIEAGRPLVLPRKPTTFETVGPPGVDQLLVLVSRQPRDFAGTGLATAGSAVPEFNLAHAEALWQSASLQRSPFVGRPICPSTARDCADEGYGATLIELTEVEATPR